MYQKTTQWHLAFRRYSARAVPAQKVTWKFKHQGRQNQNWELFSHRQHMCQISSRPHQPFRRYNSGNTPPGHKIRPAASSSNATRPKVNPRQQATTSHPCTKNRRNDAYRSGHTAPKVPQNTKNATCNVKFKRQEAQNQTWVSGYHPQPTYQKSSCSHHPFSRYSALNPQLPNFPTPVKTIPAYMQVIILLPVQAA